ncbi:UNVERIFIED_CONTAM: hypothetical protein FKN15_009705 [Acipenser sinensis]
MQPTVCLMIFTCFLSPEVDSEVVLTQSMVVKKDALSKRYYRSKCVSLWSWLLVWVNCMDCRLQVN